MKINGGKVFAFVGLSVMGIVGTTIIITDHAPDPAIAHEVATKSVHSDESNYSMSDYPLNHGKKLWFMDEVYTRFPGLLSLNVGACWDVENIIGTTGNRCTFN